MVFIFKPGMQNNDVRYFTGFLRSVGTSMTNLAGLISYKETKTPTIIEPSNIIFVIGYSEPMKFSIYIIK